MAEYPSESKGYCSEERKRYRPCSCRRRLRPLYQWRYQKCKRRCVAWERFPHRAESNRWERTDHFCGRSSSRWKILCKREQCTGRICDNGRSAGVYLWICRRRSGRSKLWFYVWKSADHSGTDKNRPDHRQRTSRCTPESDGCRWKCCGWMDFYRRISCDQRTCCR